MTSWLIALYCSLSSSEKSSGPDGPDDPRSESSSMRLLSGEASRVAGEDFGDCCPVVDSGVGSLDPSLLG